MAAPTAIKVVSRLIVELFISIIRVLLLTLIELVNKPAVNKQAI